jgi:peptide/nickel transport system substrate-binding protein
VLPEAQGGKKMPKEPGTDADKPRGELLDNVVDRRTVLKGAAALGLSAAGLPALAKRTGLGTTASEPGSGVKLWDGQQVLVPYGLSFEGTPKRGGTLKWAWLYEPIPQLDPQLPTNASVGDIDTFLWIYDQLTNITPGTLTNEPGLAESWEVAKGGLEYTFTLRDAAFSNGDPVTANDVKFSLERFANPKINSQYSFLNAIDTVEALNSKTVRIRLQFLQAMFIQVVGHGVSSIIPQRVFEKDPIGFQKKPIGSGAFIFESKTPGESISFKRNPNYWKSPKPWIDGFTLNYVPDENARMLQVTSGEADIGYTVPYALLDQYKKVTGTRLQMEPYTNVIFAAPNIRLKPLNEANIRLALNYATPRAAINQVVFKGASVLANSVIGQLQYWDPRIPYIPYDIDKARSLIAKSSVPHGFTTTLLIVGTDVDSVAVATILQNAWSDIGVTLKIEEVDLNTMFARFFSSTNPDYEICFFQPDYSSSDVGDSDELAQFFYEPLTDNFGGYFYNDKHAAALTNEAIHSLNQQLRRKLFVELQSYTTTVDPPIIPIAFGPARTLVSSKVQGLETLLNNSYRLENVWINS